MAKLIMGGFSPSPEEAFTVAVWFLLSPSITNEIQSFIKRSGTSTSTKFQKNRFFFLNGLIFFFFFLCVSLMGGYTFNLNREVNF